MCLATNPYSLGSNLEEDNKTFIIVSNIETIETSEKLPIQAALEPLPLRKDNIKDAYHSVVKQHNLLINDPIGQTTGYNSNQNPTLLS